MKIFTWMHRKLHTNVDYSMISREKDAFYEEGKKSVCEKDTEALLPDRDQVTVVDPFGLLAIGTFGFDPLHFQDGYSVHEEEYAVEEDGEEEEEEEEEEDEEEEEEEVVVNMPLPVTASFKREVEREMLKSQQPVMVSVEMEDIRRPFLKDDEERKKEGRKGERTTLADLFYADAVKISVSGEKCTAPEISAGTGKKTGCSTKQARSLAKKLMPWKAEDSRPTTKLHHLMRKMLKRKIHPEMERKVHGEIGARDASEAEAVLGDPGLKNDSSIEADGNESISLLQ
ncbi:hypothetical protein MRB53_025717 [Persea americana]|uniref:Uncharacterized protein n=1 Tax=Persea americana TaxID=3435 RepID=A0ACC2LG04_PERAE|nr:hypothetical protein MRB53_025717 [Persea americana]